MKNVNIKGVLYAIGAIIATSHILHKEITFPINPKIMWDWFIYFILLFLPITTLIEMPMVIRRIKHRQLILNRFIELISNTVYLIYGGAWIWILIREVLTKNEVL